MMRAFAALVLVLVLRSVSGAEPDKPWANGVSAEEQSAALAIYREGNAEFEESRYAQALALYRSALTHWDHPGIRFNMAVCLINLDQPLEAHQHLEAALRFGDAPLGSEAYAQGLTYRKLLDGQLASVTVSCETPDAEVTLDGAPLLRCPGKASKLLIPGSHQVVATKRGFETETTSLVLLPGKEHVHAVELAPVRVTTTTLVRRWDAKLPWIVGGSGLGLAVLGGIALLVADSEYTKYDEQLAEHCPSGCGPGPGMLDPRWASVPDGVAKHERRGNVANIVGVTLLVVGGAATAAGVVGVYLNQPRVEPTGPTIVPAADRHGASASLRWTF
jgi:hypothetical protein